MGRDGHQNPLWALTMSCKVTASDAHNKKAPRVRINTTRAVQSGACESNEQCKMGQALPSNHNQPTMLRSECIPARQGTATDQAQHGKHRTVRATVPTSSHGCPQGHRGLRSTRAVARRGKVRQRYRGRGYRHAGLAATTNHQVQWQRTPRSSSAGTVQGW